MDWLIGGVFGLLRGAVVAMLVFVVAQYVITMFISPGSGVEQLINESSLLKFASDISFLKPDGLISRIIGG